MTRIRAIRTRDLRFPLEHGAGADAVHGDPAYSYAVTLLDTDAGPRGDGAAFTLGAGNDVVCRLAAELAAGLVGREIEELMAGWGETSRALADHSQLRWLGPHKGAIHLALASVTNACFDLWAKARGVPLWQLLLDLSPTQLVDLLDLSYVEDVLDRDTALGIVGAHLPTRSERLGVLDDGYPGYDTSVGWFHYDDETIVRNARDALARGFRAMKLKVGSKELVRDVARVRLIRDAVGDDALVMVDANQQWTWPTATRACESLAALGVHWIEEPTHPDDVLGHQRLAAAVAPVAIAAGEHLPNRVAFKNYMQAGACQVVQVDALRVAGVSEFLTVSLMARRFGLPVIPHVGDMGQLHQHLVLFDHIALGHEKLFLEVIPHLAEHFVEPARIVDGRYVTPRTPGASFDFW
jgi:L-fuconate dehydratase